MNVTLFNILNGIAIDAKAAGDASTIAKMEYMVQLYNDTGTTYDASVSAATPVILTAGGLTAPLNGTIAPSYDSLIAVNPRVDLIGG